MPLDGHLEATIADFRQKYPLPPDVRYVIDGMLDYQQIDEGSYIALNLFAPRKPIMAIVDGLPSAETGAVLPIVEVTSRQQRVGAVLDLADETIRDLPGHIADGLATTSLSWLKRDLIGLANVYSMWVHEDETTGGCLKDWKKGRDIRICRNGEVWPRTARRIRTKGFIGRFVKQQQESRERRALANHILDRVERADPIPFATDVRIFNNLSEEFAAQREAARVEALRAFNAEHGDFAHQPDIKITLKKGVLLNARKRARHNRAVIKRALNVASAILPDDQVRAFTRGEGVRLPGQTLDLIIKPSGRMTDRGHGAVAVYATAPASPELLASLCTYIEKTPALDQLTGFALAMQAGEEAEVIQAANIIEMTPAGREHPLLAARAHQHIALRTARAENWTTIDRSYWSHEERRVRADAYWEETKHIWLERLAVFACGRRAKLLGAPT